MREPGRIVALFVHEIEECAGIEIAGARAHHQAGRGSESHRRVHGLPIAHGGEARAIAEMRDDNGSLRRAAERADDVLERQAMKTVAPHAFVPESAWQRETLRDLRHCPMEASVEAGYLGKGRLGC